MLTLIAGDNSCKPSESLASFETVVVLGGGQSKGLPNGRDSGNLKNTSSDLAVGPGHHAAGVESGRPRRRSVGTANEGRANITSGEVKLPRACAVLLGHRSWLTFLPPTAGHFF